MNFTHANEFSSELKTEWKFLLNNGITHVPFLRFDYLQNWWQTRGGGEWPQESILVIIQAREGNRLVGIAPCFIAPRDGKNSLLLLGSIEISDFLDFLVLPADVKPFIRGLLRYIQTTLAPQYHIENIEFMNFLEHSPNLEALRTACEETGLPCSIAPIQKSPYIPLSGDYEEYLARLDKKQRHEIRRKMRRILEIPETADWYIASNPAAIESEIQDFMRLMAFDEQKRTFLTAPMKEQMRLTMLDAFNHHYLQLAFLTIGGKKAAAYLNFDYNNRIWVYNSGIDPQFYEHSPGWVLLTHLIKWAVENGRFEFDFMRGNEDYKYKFGSEDRSVMQVSIKI
jgi:CelD/BcsL family acetyltransferase involved in cellulose biosynthesis